jgi:shikimate dehydrogenase
MTRPYAEVIGDPIAQSKSPLIHGFWLDALGIDADYRKTHVAPDALGAHLRDRAADPAWRGCNVTVPHAGLDLAGKPVTVIGTGGAARAILFALSKLEVGAVTVLARNPLKAAALLSSFGLKGRTLPIGGAAPRSALLVNTTTLGMIGQPPLELDLVGLDDDAVIYDIVYAPIETPLLAAAHARGLDTIDGLEMLVGQAAVAFALFFGAEPPRDRDDELRDLLIG